MASPNTPLDTIACGILPVGSGQIEAFDPLSAQGEKNRWDLVLQYGKTMLPHMRVWSLNAWDSLVTSLVLQGMAYSALTTPRSRGETLRSEGAALAPKQAPNAQVQPATLLEVMVLRMKVRFLAFFEEAEAERTKDRVTSAWFCNNERYESRRQHFGSLIFCFRHFLMLQTPARQSLKVEEKEWWWRSFKKAHLVIVIDQHSWANSFHFHFSMTVDGTIKAFSLHSFVGSNLCFLCGAARDRVPWSASDHGDAGGSAGVSPTQRSQWPGGGPVPHRPAQVALQQKTRGDRKTRWKSLSHSKWSEKKVLDKAPYFFLPIKPKDWVA